MTHDLLQLSEKCEASTDFFCNVCSTVSRVEWDVLTDSATALRAAHEELRTAREAYTNIGTERDLLLIERDQLRAENEQLNLRWKRKAVAYEYLYCAVLYTVTLTENNGHKSYEDIVEEIEAMLKDGQFKDEVQIDDGFGESYCLVSLDEIVTKNTENAELRAELEETKALVKRHEDALKILKSPELLEVLADIEHERWSSWMMHHLSNDTEDNRARWSELMNTPYAELSEHSKESDRREVRKTLSAIEAAMKEQA